jgi:hypothetical protein
MASRRISCYTTVIAVQRGERRGKSFQQMGVLFVLSAAFISIKAHPIVIDIKKTYCII